MSMWLKDLIVKDKSLKTHNLSLFFLAFKSTAFGSLLTNYCGYYGWPEKGGISLDTHTEE
jgi:hypothetical protein